MESGHRHELKTNELADWIEHAPEFLRKNTWNIVGIVIIILALLTWPWFSRAAARSRLAGLAKATSVIGQVDAGKRSAALDMMGGREHQDTLIMTAGSLDVEAGEAPTAAAAALILINRGEALRAELHYRAQEVPADVLTGRVGEARKAYEQALEKAKGNDTLVAMAKFGLGLCAEEEGDFAKAAEIYKAIVSDTSFAGTVYPVRAQYRLDVMDDSKQQFVFIDAPEAPKDAAAVPVAPSVGPVQISPAPPAPAAPVVTAPAVPVNPAPSAPVPAVPGGAAGTGAGK